MKLIGVDVPRPGPLAQPLGLRIKPGRRGDPLAEQPVDDHVHGGQVLQRMDLDVERRRLGQQVADGVLVEECRQPGERRLAVRVVGRRDTAGRPRQRREVR